MCDECDTAIKIIVTISTIAAGVERRSERLKLHIYRTAEHFDQKIPALNGSSSSASTRNLKVHQRTVLRIYCSLLIAAM